MNILHICPLHLSDAATLPREIKTVFIFETVAVVSMYAFNFANPEHISLGIVELCAKILQIMRNDFKDYARTFCQLCAPFSIQISINQERK